MPKSSGPFAPSMPRKTERLSKSPVVPGSTLLSSISRVKLSDGNKGWAGVSFNISPGILTKEVLSTVGVVGVSGGAARLFFENQVNISTKNTATMGRIRSDQL